MKPKCDSILVAVDELPRTPNTVLRKAAWIARQSAARVELFHVISDARNVATSRPLPDEEIEARQAALTEKRLLRMRQLSRSPVFRGIDVQCKVVWEAAAYRAIIRRALATRPALLIAGTHRHTLTMRLLLGSTDWDLIRYCPVPLLLVRSTRKYRAAPVVVAVDPFHAYEKPAGLDARLLKFGRTFAALMHGDLHVFHAYMPLVPLQTLPMAAAAPLILMPPEQEPAHQHQVERSIDKLALSAGIPKRRCHVQMGHVPEELADVVRRTGAGLVVMGAISRSTLARLVLGNTAERVIDKLSCDLLVIKPRGFRKTLRALPRQGAARGSHSADMASGSLVTI